MEQFQTATNATNNYIFNGKSNILKKTTYTVEKLEFVKKTME